MTESALFGIAIIVALSIGAQWLAWRVRWPAIVLLLLCGFAAGPVTGLVSPDQIFGDLLFPIVSISVAIILFEGGLTLRWSEMRQLDVVRRLVTVGVLVTWIGAALAAWWLTDLSGGLSVLLGAILVVTGPTVIMPMLRQLKLKGQVGPVLKWEGILNDPIGAVLAVLVFEALLAQHGGAATQIAAVGLIRAIVAGAIGGVVGAAVLIPLIRWYWIPDHLHSPVALALVVVIFAVTNHMQHESGLLAVTLMGAIMANQNWADIKPILAFKENLRVFLIGVLFIILAARVEMASLKALTFESAVFVAVLVLIVRPVSVMLSTVGTALAWHERLYLAMISPRGIVAAAVASAFAIEMSAAGVEGADRLVPIMFLVIIGTIGFSGLLASPLSHLLKVADDRPSGYLIIGAHRLARYIAQALHERGVAVMMVDSNWSNVRAARMEGLPVYHGNIMANDIADRLPLEGIGRLLAMSSNDEANALAALRFVEQFGRPNIYQLIPEAMDPEAMDHPSSPRRVGGRYLFSESSTYGRLISRIYRGERIKATSLTEQFDFEAFEREHSADALPLFYEQGDGDIFPFTAEREHPPQAGERLISLVQDNHNHQRKG